MKVFTTNFLRMGLVKEFEYIPIIKGVVFIFFSHHLTPHIIETFFSEVPIFLRMCLVKEFEYIPIDKGVAFIFFSHHLTPHIKVLFKSMNDFAYKEIAYIFLNSENCSVIQWTLMEFF
uniref:Uncharacterized protein n=1 Tax=Arundo donax TaxID=35708 RepID=A0A0A9AJS1_ARUDO